MCKIDAICSDYTVVLKLAQCLLRHYKIALLELLSQQIRMAILRLLGFHVKRLTENYWIFCSAECALRIILSWSSTHSSIKHTESSLVMLTTLTVICMLIG